MTVYVRVIPVIIEETVLFLMTEKSSVFVLWRAILAIGSKFLHLKKIFFIFIIEFLRCQNDPCTNSPCKNGGTCHLLYENDDVTFRCDCEIGYFGSDWYFEFFAFQKMILYFSTTTDCDPGGKNIECLNGGTCDVTSSLNRFHYQNGSYVEAYAQCTCVRFEDQIFIKFNHSSGLLIMLYKKFGAFQGYVALK